MKKIIRILLAIIGIFIIVLVAVFSKMMIDINNLKYHELNLNELNDGSYLGEASATLVSVKVEVKIDNHEIIDIDILDHRHGRGEKAETIIDDMIQMNTYDVDTISGATASSLVIKSAVSDALMVDSDE